MSLNQIYNIREPELFKRIANFTNIEVATSGVYRGVYTKNNNKWSMLFGVLALGGSTKSNEHQACCYKYPEYQFICQPVKGITLGELIKSLERGAGLPVPSVPALEHGERTLNWTESLIPSHLSNHQFPIRRFSARLSSDVECRECKLVAHGMTFHASAFEYVKEFLGLDRFHGSSDGKRGELCIDIADQRGHLVLSNEEVRYYCKATDTLAVVGEIDGDPVNLSSSQDRYIFEQEKVSDVELWLVTDSDEIVDYRSSSEREYRYGSQTNNSGLIKLLQIITAGESEYCEFKQYIDLVSKKNNKAWELDKTVCAFSNHQGGKLFVGVDDDTRIVGINEGCQQHYQCAPNEGAECYQKAVIKRLQESLNKNQCFSTYLIEHDGLFILVIDVHKANGLNYLLTKKEAYIRRGASSAQLTPSEIQAFPVDRDVLGLKLIVDEPAANRGVY